MDKVILNAVMKARTFKIHFAIFHIQKENFLSMRYLTEKGSLITFKGDECVLFRMSQKHMKINICIDDIQ